MINDFFYWCVNVLKIIGNVTGMGYELANIVIFVILQPGLILLFIDVSILSVPHSIKVLIPCIIILLINLMNNYLMKRMIV